MENPVLAAKQQALDVFLRRLQAEPIWHRVARVVLYGSVLRGEATLESDIDVLLVGTGDLRHLEDTASDIAFDVMLETGQRVEPLVYCPEAFTERAGVAASAAGTLAEDTRGSGAAV